MSKTLELADAERLVDSNDKYWWETYGKTLVSFRPHRFSTEFSKNGYYNRAWRGRNKWGFVKRIEVSNDGKFRL